MTLRESIIHSLNEYKSARIKRREAFGPDLVDTINDIGKATYVSARDSVQKTQQSVSYKFQYALSKTTEKANEFWSGAKMTIKSAREVVADKLNATSDGAAKLKHSAAESLRDRIKQYRVGTAIGLNRLSYMLKGQDNKPEVKQTPEPAKVVERDKLPEIDTDNEMKTFLTPKMRAKFIEYYVRNHETAHRVFEDLDRQQNPAPKLRDYMVRCGFDAFLETVIDAPDMNELRAAVHADRVKDEELQSFKDLAQQIDQNMLIQNEIIKAHNEKQEASTITEASTKKQETLVINDQPIKSQESPTTANNVVNTGKNPHQTDYNPPAATNYDTSLYDEVPPEFEQPVDFTQHIEPHYVDFAQHIEPHDPQESSYDGVSLTPDDLSEFAEFNGLHL